MSVVLNFEVRSIKFYLDVIYAQIISSSQKQTTNNNAAATAAAAADDDDNDGNLEYIYYNYRE
jgi:hypothetical protein